MDHLSLITLAARDPDIPTQTGEVINPTIAPYHHGLNGVDQPLNLVLKDVLWVTLGGMAVALLVIRIGTLIWAQLRLVSAMSVEGEKQTYWKVNQWSWMPSLKRNLIYAPIWKKRQNREFRLANNIKMGSLPSRLQTLVLLGYLASNIAYMFMVNWGNMNKYELCAQIRGRSGTLSVANMLALVILAARNNPLIGWLQISFDTMNLLHRWMGRVVVIEVLVHLLAWLIVQVADGGWSSVADKIMNDRFISSGMAGTGAMALLLVLAISPLRSAFYETFINLHILLAAVAFICTWIHCVSASAVLPSTAWIQGVLALWVAERVARLFRLAYCNLSRRRHVTEALVEAMPGEVCRVTMRLPRYVDIRPGSHAYLRFKGLGGGGLLFENHPFSIAWVDYTYNEDALPLTNPGAGHSRQQKPIATTVSFLIGAQQGMTRSLYNKACEAPRHNSVIALHAGFEGPHAGHHSLDSYGHVILVAGATGITHVVSYLKHLMDGFDKGTVATRRISLIWIVRDRDSMEWIHPWMRDIMNRGSRRDILHISLFVTRPSRVRETISNSSTVRILPGRPNIPSLLAKEVQEQMGAMAVVVCGPGGMVDDVRSAVRDVQDGDHCIDFIPEVFSYA